MEQMKRDGIIPVQLTREQERRRAFVVGHIAPLLKEVDHDIAEVRYIVHPTGRESGCIKWINGNKLSLMLDVEGDNRDILAAYLRMAGARVIW